MHRQPNWLKEEALQRFFAATKDAGGEARAVGGCVRDFLLGIEGSDVDVASTLSPQKTIVIAKAQGWKAIPTGIDHGTVTLFLAGRPVEVTTLRRDVKTDGRHATVAFTDDWEEDAARRDFTINALYMDAGGTLYDYHDGEKDIFGHRIAFIGDAATRITEDGLRMLRYFRFLATHGKPPADGEALAAIAAKKEMVTQLSGERIANEMRKSLSAQNPAYALRLMHEAGLASLVFGAAIDPSTLIRMHLLESKADYQVSVWGRALVLLGGPSPENAKGIFDLSQGRGDTAGALSANGKASGDGDAGSVTSPLGEVDAPEDSTNRATKFRASGEGHVGWLSNRWKLSRHESQQLELLTRLPPFRADAPRHFHTRLIRKHSAPAYLDWLLMQAALQQGLDISPFVTLSHEFKPPVFPISAKDLMEQGMTEGKALGEKLATLEQQWEESDYRLTKEELLR